MGALAQEFAVDPVRDISEVARFSATSSRGRVAKTAGCGPARSVMTATVGSRFAAMAGCAWCVHHGMPLRWRQAVRHSMGTCGRCTSVMYRCVFGDHCRRVARRGAASCGRRDAAGEHGENGEGATRRGSPAVIARQAGVKARREQALACVRRYVPAGTAKRWRRRCWAASLCLW